MAGVYKRAPRLRTRASGVGRPPPSRCERTHSLRLSPPRQVRLRAGVHALGDA